ncbi:MAG TPA: DUF3300 domain-containing protein, partial [Psychromonas sp.]
DSLSGMANMLVTRVDNQIIIESAYKGVIYVPYYDPRVVYGHWHWYSHPPVYWTPSAHYVRRPHVHFYWNSGIQITFNYYFSTFNWHRHHIIVVNHHNSHGYRHRERIATSYGAQRWHHKPQHRYQVTEGKPHLQQRENSPLPSSMQSIKVPRSERQQLNDSKINQHSVRNRSSLELQNKQLEKGDRSPQIKSEQRTHSGIKIYPQEKPAKSHQPAQTKSEQRTHSGIKIYPQEKPVKSHQPAQTRSEQRTHDRIKIYPRENSSETRAHGNTDTGPSTK